MIEFLIESTISLSVLLIVYHLFLEGQKMHRFNRFYLLAALIFSITIPFITVELIDHSPIYVNAAPQSFSHAVLTPPAESSYDWSLVFGLLYGIITVFMIWRFVTNIIRFSIIERQSETVTYKSSKLVLIDEKVLPHTFINRIFINKGDYENQAVEEELLAHELAHVNQNHTYDILLIEILISLLWFNPLLQLYKKAIQLNHEFLADEKVVNAFRNIPFYQQLLLTKATSPSVLNLASQLNFQLTKKRLMMMTKTTSTTTANIRKIALVPIFCTLIYFTCFETVAQMQKPTTSKEKPTSIDNSRDTYYQGVYVIVRNTNDNKVVLAKRYEQLTQDEKNRYLPNVPKPLEKITITPTKFEAYKNTKLYAIWIDGQNVTNSKLGNYKTSDFAIASESFVHKNARSKKFSQSYQVSMYTNSYFDKNLQNSHLKYSGDTLKIYHSTSSEPTKKKDQVNYKSIQKETTAVQTPISANETTPEFPGGITTFYKFFFENYKIPTGFASDEKLLIGFTITKDGSLANYKVVKDPGSGTADEAIRVLKLSPKWKPATKDGLAADAEFYLPIQLQQKK